MCTIHSAHIKRGRKIGTYQKAYLDVRYALTNLFLLETSTNFVLQSRQSAALFFLKRNFLYQYSLRLFLKKCFDFALLQKF